MASAEALLAAGQRRFGRVLWIGLVYLSVYVFLDWMSFVYPFHRLNITPWNPPPAATLLLLLLFGFRWLPLTVAAPLLADLVVRQFAGPWQASLLTALAEAMSYGIGAWLIRFPFPIDLTLPRLGDVIGLTVAVTTAAILSALVYVDSYWLFNAVSTNQVPKLVFQYWVGDTIGTLVPCALALVYWNKISGPRPLLPPIHWETLAQIVTFALVFWLVLLHPIIDGTRIFYLVFVPVIWVAAKDGLPGVTIALMVVQIAIIVSFELVGRDALVVTRLQFLMLTMALTGLFLGAVISERERAREAADKAEIRLRAIIDMAPDGMVVADCNGQVQAANRLFGALSGLPQEELIGQEIQRFIGGSLPHEHADSETSLLRADGEMLPVEVAVASLEVFGKQNFVMTFRDITARKQAEERRNLRRVDLEVMSRSILTEEIAAALAHELNQPLSAVIGYMAASRRLLASVVDLPPRVLDHLANAAAQAERAGKIVGRLRDFFRNGQVVVEEMVVRQVIDDVATLLADEIVRTQTEVKIDVPAELIIHADRLQIEQVLINLIRNSLQALAETTSAGRKVSITAKELAPDCVQITVADNGPGIAEEMADSLFRPFFSTRPSGMGLGLSICLSIIEGNGGSLWNDPPDVGGAAFHFILPSLSWSPSPNVGA